MKALRYIITRPCLQQGSMSLLKYLRPIFPESGPVQFVDDLGHEHTVQVDHQAGRILGLGPLYQNQNLGVNDVLLLTPLQAGRYQIEAITKPHHSPAPAARSVTLSAPELRRVVIAATPHVREVRLESNAPRIETLPLAMPEEAKAAAVAHTPLTPVSEPTPLQPVAPAPLQTSERTEPLPRPTDAAMSGTSGSGTSGHPLAELARLTGYSISYPQPQVARLDADLGDHRYSVAVALDQSVLQRGGWQQGCDYFAVLLGEGDMLPGVPRLTHEALLALIEHAQLAPLTAVDLRGYWNAGNINLEAVDSISELVGGQLAQRGAFSYLLVTLAQYPAHSVIRPEELGEQLGHALNAAELTQMLQTLSSTPFLALSPLPSGDYLLKVGVRDLLLDIAEYAEGVRRRVKPARASASEVALA